MKKKIKLNRCPFCGELPKVAKNMPIKGLVSISCENRKCQVHPYVVKYDKKSAANAWNNRADEWIPVDERLPNEDGFYLCTHEFFDSDGKMIDVGVLAQLFSNGSFRKYGARITITAWRELPEPYREGE